MIDQDHCFTMADVKSLILGNNKTRLTITLDNSDSYEVESSDVFNALLEIRKETEPKGIKFLIQGCRKNCWPSGMSLSMSNGMKVYEMQLAPDIHPKLVDTFDEALEVEVGTLQEQKSFQEEWFQMKTTNG